MSKESSNNLDPNHTKYEVPQALLDMWSTRLAVSYHLPPEVLRLPVAVTHQTHITEVGHLDIPLGATQPDTPEA